MKTLIRIVCIGALFAVTHPAVMHAQTSETLEEVRVDWHLAGVSEATSDFRSALGYFRDVVDKAQYLPLVSREWYRGMGWLGVARSKARLSDTCGARRALAAAFSHSFSNAALLQLDSFFAPLVGPRFIDSLDVYWTHLRAINMSQWVPQEPIVLRPHDARPGQPLIIALHGGNGNYKGFASYWANIADSAHATIVVPAGIIRNSEVQNSWEFDIKAIAPVIESLRSECIIKFQPDTARIYLAGFSQGAQAALALTLLYPAQYCGALAFSGFMLDSLSDSVISRAAAQHPRIYAWSGEWDAANFIQSLTDIQKRAMERGIPFHLELEDQMSHEMPLDFQRRFSDAWRWIRQPEQHFDAQEVSGSGQ